jgi:nucleoid-associated protein YgaU
LHYRALENPHLAGTQGVHALVPAVCMAVLVAALATPGAAQAQSAGATVAAPQVDEDRLAGCEARVQALEAALAEREARLAALERQVDELDPLRRRLDSLSARLPTREGGSVTADEAKRQAEADAAGLRELLQKARGIDNPRLWGELRAAENALHRSQFLLARAEGARTVYRVRPGDDLQRIGLMFYGDPERWTQLYDANRHVIDDPNAALPGITLVVP